MANIMVAMSGGVDSSLTAALLKEQGHDVTGVTMHLWEGDDERLFESQCCSQEMTAGARRVCAQLGVPYYVFNYQREFRRHVIDYFLKEYAHGYTPNPCLACNRDMKFRVLLERAQALGFDYLATGHYVRIADESGAVAGPETGYLLQTPGRRRLLRSADRAKDQSYVLYMLQQDELSRLIFPLGGYTKAQVREMAAARGLATAHKPESMDICFIPDNDYRRFLQEEQPETVQPGPIVNRRGEVLGEHRGLPLYTVGQRKGLGITSSHPLYVIELDTARNMLVVGSSEELERREFVVEDVKFVDGGWPRERLDCEVQIRAHAQPAPAQIAPLSIERLVVQCERPQRAVTPGQAAVFYHGDEVLGGGRISAEGLA